MRTSIVLLCALVAGVAVFSVQADEGFGASYYAGAPGDDNMVYGSLALKLDIEDTDADDESIEYEIRLFNANEVTGVHLHLQGNSSDGLFGGPLVLALTNTTSSPVSGPGPQQASVQEGSKTNEDLVNNPQRAQVQARLQALGQTGSPPNNAAELAALIRANLIYTDVHTVQRVSPQGLVRSRVYITGPVQGDD